MVAMAAFAAVLCGFGAVVMGFLARVFWVSEPHLAFIFCCGVAFFVAAFFGAVFQVLDIWLGGSAFKPLLAVDGLDEGSVSSQDSIREAA